MKIKIPCVYMNTITGEKTVEEIILRDCFVIDDIYIVGFQDFENGDKSLIDASTYAVCSIRGRYSDDALKKSFYDKVDNMKNLGFHSYGEIVQNYLNNICRNPKFPVIKPIDLWETSIYIMEL